MGKECNLELALSPISSSASASGPPIPMTTMPLFITVKHHHHHHQQILVFSNGRPSFFDLTELQARATIRLASEEENGNSREWVSLPMNGNERFSIKKSLQRFLQSRKTRIHSLSPYHKF